MILKAGAPSTGLARVLSKLGFCSRREAVELILAGRVQVDGRPCRQIDLPVDFARSVVRVDGVEVGRSAPVYVMLNKPRGLVTTTADEKGRSTVMNCIDPSRLPRLFPVGRLDQASEGLLFLTNDTAWANRITDPRSGCQKIYHVQINCLPSPEFLERLLAGVESDGEFLQFREVRMIRQGGRNSWLEIVLVEGRNRHIRRSMAVLGSEVLQLVRIAVGGVQLGNLAKGQWRHLTSPEVAMLSSLSPPES